MSCSWSASSGAGRQSTAPVTLCHSRRFLFPSSPLRRGLVGCPQVKRRAMHNRPPRLAFPPLAQFLAWTSPAAERIVMYAQSIGLNPLHPAMADRPTLPWLPVRGRRNGLPRAVRRAVPQLNQHPSDRTGGYGRCADWKFKTLWTNYYARLSIQFLLLCKKRARKRREPARLHRSGRGRALRRRGTVGPRRRRSRDVFEPPAAEKPKRPVHAAGVAQTCCRTTARRGRSP